MTSAASLPEPLASAPIAWRELHRHTLELLQSGSSSLWSWVVLGFGVKLTEIFKLSDVVQFHYIEYWEIILSLTLSLGLGYTYGTALMAWGRALEEKQIWSFGRCLQSSLPIFWTINLFLIVPTLQLWLGLLLFILPGIYYGVRLTLYQVQLTLDLLDEQSARASLQNPKMDAHLRRMSAATRIRSFDRVFRERRGALWPFALSLTFDFWSAYFLCHGVDQLCSPEWVWFWKASGIFVLTFWRIYFYVFCVVLIRSLFQALPPGGPTLRAVSVGP